MKSLQFKWITLGQGVTRVEAKVRLVTSPSPGYNKVMIRASHWSSPKVQDRNRQDMNKSNPEAGTSRKRQGAEINGGSLGQEFRVGGHKLRLQS